MAMKVWMAGIGLIVVASTVDAQVVGFISMNALAQQPATSDFSQAGSGPSREEIATMSSAQEFGTSIAYDVGGGVLRGGPRWRAGIGVAFSRVQDGPTALVSLTLPHPILFNRPGTASKAADEGLERRETVTHLHLVLETNLGPATVRLSGGPSYVRFAHTLVSGVRVHETLDLSPQLPYAVSITDLETSEATGSAWGYNVGVDVGVFFSQHLGIGGLVRYSRATAELPNALQRTLDGGGEATSEETLGGVSVGGGLRLRF